MEVSLKQNIILVLLLALLFSACQNASATNAGAITLTDMAGRQVSLNKPAEKIIALSPADCEILFAIGAGATLIGRGSFCDYPPEALSIAEVASGTETNLEQIISLAPQVVIMNTMAQTQEQVDALEKAGIKVVVTGGSSGEVTSIEGIYTIIGLLGQVTGKTTESKKVVDDMKAAFAGIQTQNTGKTVYFEVSPLEYGLWTTGSNTFMNEIAEILGLANIFQDIAGWAEVSEEEVILRNPDYIVTVTMYYGEGVSPVDEIMGRPGWQDITAVKNKHVFISSSDEITRPGPRLKDAVLSLYSFIYEK
jgi:iron complex transport system substrate-binding protein